MEHTKHNTTYDIASDATGEKKSDVTSDVARVLDALLSPPVRLVARLRVPPPVMWLLGPARRAALEAVLPGARAEAAILTEGLLHGDAKAEAAFADLAERSLDSFWREVARRARACGERTDGERTDGARAGEAGGAWSVGRAAGALLAWLHELDQRFHQSDELEHMDDPGLPRELGQRLVRQLDRMNLMLGSYEVFFTAMRPFLGHDRGQVGSRPLRVLELAAGAGGFSLWLAREARRQGIRLEVIASDLRLEYLDPARARASAEALPLAIMELDALRSEAYPSDVDVVICAQALHHFPPGTLALLFHRAAERARRGVLFVDGCRSLLLAGAFLGLTGLRFADREYLHDAWISFRRFYLPQELALLCGLGPFGDGVAARHLAPGHCMVVRRASTNR